MQTKIQKILTSALVSLVASIALQFATAAETNSPANAEAAYTQVLEKRVGDILAALDLKDAEKTKKVHDILVAQYRALNDWHNANDAKRKTAKGEKAEQINSSLKTIHDKFLAALSTELTPEQIETVKDKMTYGKVQFTYKGYLVENANLTEPQKEKILELLKEARESAMDGGSAGEKTAIFQKYKGKINNYLSSQGVTKKKKTENSATNSPAAH
jgi:Spy/CpxP family protein refolding chaperone